jgi:hypothetical protein
MKLDSEIYGGELTRKIENYRRLVAEKADVRAVLDAAEAELKAAQEAGLVATVSAKLNGESVSESSRIGEAEAALRAARYDFDATRRAVQAAMDSMVDEAKGPEYAARLDAVEGKLRSKAVAALSKLEATLEEISGVKGHRQWLSQPNKGNKTLEVFDREVFIEAESMRKPNGDPAGVRDLTKPLREALLGEKPPRTQAEWGLPVGYRMSGPWGTEKPVNESFTSEAAATVFDELATEPIEIQRSVPPAPPTEETEAVPA